VTEWRDDASEHRFFLRQLAKGVVPMGGGSSNHRTRGRGLLLFRYAPSWLYEVVSKKALP